MAEFGDARLPPRFWDKVSPEPNSGCWLWMGGVAPGGYGSFHFNGRWRCNRLAFHQLVKPVPRDLCVCHRCDNPYCVNPDHLFLGTHTENMRDMFSKGRRIRRYRKATCKRGHSRAPENLIKNECRECRRLRQRVGYTKEIK